MSLFTLIVALLLAAGAMTLALWMLATLIWTVILRKALAALIAAVSAGLAQLTVSVLTFPKGPIAADHFFTQAGVFIAVWSTATLILMNLSGFAFACWRNRDGDRDAPLAAFGWTGVFDWTLRQVRLDQDAAYVPPAIEGFLQEGAEP